MEVDTRYGRLSCLIDAHHDDEGRLVQCTPGAPLTLPTLYGDLTPQFEEEDLRRPRVEPLVFHPNGEVKSIALQYRHAFKTPLGMIDAEAATFHEDGTLRRIFPLAGKPSGMYDWKQEYALAEPLTLRTAAGEVDARCISLHFHPNGMLRSLTLWPPERVAIQTPLGPLMVRTGVAFHPSGKLRSCEPAAPVEIGTPLGAILAFDPDPDGISGDVNSLHFHEDGSLAGLCTPAVAVCVTDEHGAEHRFQPAQRPNLCDEEKLDTVPLTILFHGREIVLGEKSQRRFDMDRHAIRLEPWTAAIGAVEYECG